MDRDMPIGFFQPDGAVVSLVNGQTFNATGFRGLIFYSDAVDPRTIEHVWPWRQATRGKHRKPGYTGPLGAVRHIEAWMAKDEAHAAELAREGAALTGKLHGSVASIGRGFLPKELFLSKHRHQEEDDLLLDAIHQGPIVATRGYVPSAIYLDRKGAFLQAMRDPLPIPAAGPTRCLPTPGEVLDPRWCGTVCGLVKVPFSWIPPLPARSNLSKWSCIQAYGTVCGQWSADILRQAVIDFGCEIVRIIVGWKAPMVSRWLAPMADRIDRLPKELRKRVYLTAWGSLLGRGYLSGSATRPETVDNKKTVHIFPDSSLYWSQVDVRGPNLRPDVAAVLTGKNWIEMMKTIQHFGDRVALAHIDSVMVSAPARFDAIRDVPPGFGVKGVGALRIYGVGNYDLSGMGADARGDAGLRPGSDPEEHRKNLDEHGRQWQYRYPSQDPNAIGLPIYQEHAVGPKPFIGLSTRKTACPVPPSYVACPLDLLDVPDGEVGVWCDEWSGKARKSHDGIVRDDGIKAPKGALIQLPDQSWAKLV